MTHPYREELAGRLDKARNGTPFRKTPNSRPGFVVDERTLEQAAAALRQSPTVEEVARVIDPTLEGVDLSGPCSPKSRIGRALETAQAIADLYGRGG